MYSVVFAGLVGLAASAPTPTVQEATSTFPLSARAGVARSLEIANVLISRSRSGLEARDSSATVTGSAAVTSINNNDGIGAGSNSYTNYGGDGSAGAGWPSISDWVSFEDMFNNNKPNMQNSCSDNYGLANDSGDEVGAIYDAIQSVAQQSGVDHRFILATMMQESSGCVRVTTTANGYSNPGLMQSFEGYYTCNDNTNIEGDNYEVRDPCPTDYIKGMIREGAVGTDTGDGLASNINQAQDQGTSDAQTFYYAARLYNSGSVCNGDLSDACGATQSYSADIANRLTGWTG